MFISEDSQKSYTLLPLAMIHPRPTCSQAGHHQSKLGLVLFLRHIVEGTTQVLFSLGEFEVLDLQPRPLSDDLSHIVALGDPDVAVRWVGVRLAFKEDLLSRVDSEHLPCP